MAKTIRVTMRNNSDARRADVLADVRSAKCRHIGGKRVVCTVDDDDVSEAANLLEADHSVASYEVEVSDDDIRALKNEAAEAGDHDQAVLCLVALGEYGDDYEIDPDDFSVVSHSFRRFRGLDVAGARKEIERVLSDR